MTTVARAIPWAVAMTLLALGAHYGLVENRSAATMFAILPALAVATLSRTRCCGLTARSEGAVQ